MSAYYQVNLTASTNSDLHHAFRLADDAGAPVSLVGASLAMAVKNAAGDIVLTATPANGRLSISDAAAGAYELNVPASVVSTLPPGVYDHDLVFNQSGHTLRLWKGSLAVEAGIGALS